MEQTTLPEVKQLASALSFDDQLVLLEHLAQTLRSASPAREPRDLRGIWAGKFPNDFDVDAALHEIRTEWEKEWTDGGEFVG